VAWKVAIKWFAGLFGGRRVTSDRGGVAIGGHNYGSVSVLTVTDTPPQAVLDDLDGYLARQAARQLESERHSGKYIPDVFVETRTAKNLARTFAHPALFFQRSMEGTHRISIAATNRFLTKAGLPTLSFPIATDDDAALSMTKVSDTSARVIRELSETKAEIEKLRTAGSNILVKAGCEAYFSENSYHMQMFGWGLARDIDARQDELNAVKARVFILVGRAGQGKTNFVCDFVDNFLFKHGIPCAYITGRRLSTLADESLDDAIRKLTFPDAGFSFHDAEKLLSEHAEKIQKPFVLIVDGINEHRRIANFSIQLESFIEAVMAFPHIKLLLTCRSEFFDQRFGNLLRSPSASRIFLQRSPERERDEDQHYEDLQAGYFAFFIVDTKKVSRQVLHSLKSDILLLRFFCEAYGAKNKPSNYVQPNIRNLYRGEIFRTYLERKLGAANLFIQQGSDKLAPQGALPDLISVLQHTVEHMLRSAKYGDVPISVIPENLHDALYGLLDEELVLRRDAPASGSVFSSSQDTINFTFDEFRDYLLAQYLVDRVFNNDPSEFQKYVDNSTPVDSEAIEGTKRYLFYASRDEQNPKFFDFFRCQQWYADVYSVEVFNIDTRSLEPEDVDHVIDLLRTGGHIAREVARSLAVRWNKDDNRLLNLDVLVSYLSQLDDREFDSAAKETFRTVRYDDNGLSATAFCKFITRVILIDINSYLASTNSLFAFLILLFPVDDAPDLENECMATFRSFMAQFPSNAADLLLQSLNYRTAQHKPYAWRLLAEFYGRVSVAQRETLEALIREIGNSGTTALQREMARYVDRSKLIGLQR
jgi:hypothetical protein